MDKKSTQSSGSVGLAPRQHAEACFFEGNSYMAAGESAKAEASFRQALALVPEFAEAHANLGLLLEQRGELGEAEYSYLTAVRLNSDCALTQLNFGVFLATQKRFAAAEQHYLLAIELNPSAAAAWSNLGVLYACMQREEQAEACYRNAMQLDANYANARYNLSYLLLRQARFEEGWACLEFRPTNALIVKWMAAQQDCPRWSGQEVHGKSLMIVHEGGHGDMVQFCRYAALLKTRGAAYISLLCPPALKALLSTLEAVDQVIAFDEAISSTGWDLWVPLFSLPYLSATRLHTIPAEIPYLSAEPGKVATWRTKLTVLTDQITPTDHIASTDQAAPANHSAPSYQCVTARQIARLQFPDKQVKDKQVQSAHKRVGLVWRGNPRHENDGDRSLHDFSLLTPLWELAHIHFFGLQKEATNAELSAIPAHVSFTHLGTEMADFAEMAAIIDNLDLLITVDTAAAHLAGALGKPCWILLPTYKTDWRWLEAGSDTPWYPQSTRLFRQPEMGDWSGVMQALVLALRAL